MCASATFIDSKDHDFVVNTEKGPRYCWWNNPNWGYGWQGGFQFVDLDRDGVFEYRYFLKASADGNTENAGYLYQPGMEISDLDKEGLQRMQTTDRIIDGQVFCIDGTPRHFYKYGRPIENSPGVQYRFDNLVFNDTEGRLGNMRLELPTYSFARYYQQSVCDREAQLGIDGMNYYQALSYSDLPMFSMTAYYGWSRKPGEGNTREAEHDRNVISSINYYASGEYITHIDSKGVKWYVYYSKDRRDIFAEGYIDYMPCDLSHVKWYPDVEQREIIWDGVDWRGYLNINNAAELGIDLDYVASHIEFVDWQPQ